MSEDLNPTPEPESFDDYAQAARRLVDGGLDPMPIFSDAGSGPLEPEERDRMPEPDAIVIRDGHIEHLENKVAKLEHEARHDQLTGILNEQGFKEAAQKEIEAHPGTPYGLFTLDLGNFKFINDTYGHAHGDDILKAVATRLRSSDLGGFAARPHGDEFFVLAPLVSRPDREQLEPAQIVELMKARFYQIGQELAAEYDSLQQEGNEFSIAAGGVQYDGEQDIQDALSESDTDMYATKQKLRETHGVYDRRSGN